MEEPAMRETEQWMPPLYSKGPLYTRGLTDKGIEEVSDESAQMIEEMLEACRESGIDLQLEEVGCRRYHQLDEVQRKELVSYCMELDFWHEDLDFLLFEMDTSVRYFHQDRLDLKRLAVIYHTDNFYFRLHAYREKVFKLVSVFLGLGIPDRHLQFNDKVFEKLKERGLSELSKLLSALSSDSKLSNDPIWSEAIARRNPLAHRLAKRDSGILKSDERIYDHIYVRGDTEKKDKITDLNLYHIIKLEEFGRICERLSSFRDEVVLALRVCEIITDTS